MLDSRELDYSILSVPLLRFEWNVSTPALSVAVGSASSSGAVTVGHPSPHVTIALGLAGAVCWWVALGGPLPSVLRWLL